MTIAAKAEALIGQSDLYAALRALGKGLSAPETTGLLPALLAHLHEGEDAARTVADRLRSVDQGLLQAVIRRGAGLPAVDGADALRQSLATAEVSALFRPDVATARTMALLTQGQRPDMPAFSDRAFDDWFRRQAVDYGLGSYGEKRTVYETAQFADAASPERRTCHLGIDVFAPAGTPVYAPLAGKVAFVTYNADPLDYGHTLILEHALEGLTFWTLYGHLGASLPGLCRPGDSIAPGQIIAHLGDWHENGGWAAHIHFQLMSSLLAQTGGNFFGVGHESLWDVWADICPDPNLLLRIGAEKFQV